MDSAFSLPSKRDLHLEQFQLHWDQRCVLVFEMHHKTCHHLVSASLTGVTMCIRLPVQLNCDLTRWMGTRGTRGTRTPHMLSSGSRNA